MKELFDAALAASISGSIIIILILILRLFLKDAPKRYVCLLWLLAAVRLLVPLNIESSLSLQPKVEQVTVQRENPATNTVMEAPGIEVDFGASAVVVPSVSVQLPSEQIDPGLTESGGNIVYQQPTDIVPVIWFAVTCGFLAYMVISYIVLTIRVKDAVAVDGNVYECAAISSPFLLGYCKPRIYLPEGLPAGDLEHILAHERAHIRRLDNWTKLFMFLCLAVHWFNPLVWIAYVLLCRDVEMACDEMVVRDMTLEDRKAYSKALVNCAANMRLVSTCPVAFGEVSVKARILKVLNYRRPMFWVSLTAVIAIVFVTLCFMTNPAVDKGTVGERCRTALKEFQSTRSYHVVGRSASQGDRMWLCVDTPENYQAWNGYNRDWLCYSAGESVGIYRLQRGNDYYAREVQHTENGETTDSGWYGSSWPWESSWQPVDPPVVSFDWDAQPVTVKRVEQVAVTEKLAGSFPVDATKVTLLVEDKERTFEMVFFLDEQDRLFAVETDDLHCDILSNDPVRISALVEGLFADNATDPQSAVIRCRELLDSERLYLYDDTNRHSFEDPITDYIRIGENWMTIVDGQESKESTLYYDGQYFRRVWDHGHGRCAVSDTGWQPVEMDLEDSALPWIFSVDWENAEVIAGVGEGLDGSGVVTLRLPEQDATLQMILYPEGIGYVDVFWNGGSQGYRILDLEANGMGQALDEAYAMAMGQGEDQEARWLRQCRQALESLSGTSYSVIQYDLLDNRTVSTVTYTYAGDDWLIRNPPTVEAYAQIDGQQYARGGSYGENWVETDLSGEAAAVLPWFLNLEWDETRMFFHYRSDWDNSVTVSVADESCQLGCYTLEFFFDETTGALTGITRSETTGSAGSWTTASSRATVISGDAELLSANIRDYLFSAGAEIP